MKTKLLITAIISLILTACEKDQFTTIPQLTFKQVNATEFHIGDLVEFELEYTDKEGDIQNKIYLEEVTLDLNCPDNNFKSLYQVPTDVPDQNQAKGTILIRYTYGQLGQYPIYPGPKCQRNDTCYFRFALTDRADNVSDTITSPQVVFVK